MSYYSSEKAKKSLPFLYIIIPLISATIILFFQRFDQFNPLRLWYLVPLWVISSHILCGFSYVITSLSLKHGIGLFINSFSVYRKRRSPVHFQVAFLTSLLEEIIFRYFFLLFLTDLLKNPFLAVLLTSFAFTLFHFRFGFHLKSIIQYIDFFIFSLIISSLNLLTQSFYPAFIIHGMRNYILKVLLVTKKEYEEMKKEKGNNQ
jgi:membrane protease YdiL (CAAX protease family)